MVKVSATVKNGLDAHVHEIRIEKDGVEIKLNAEEWRELQATLDGERTACHTPLEEGCYYPKESFVTNIK